MELKNWDNTEAAVVGEYEELPLGGHVCVIRKVDMTKAQSGKDMLVIEFDIAEGEAEGFYLRRYEKDMKFNAEKAKWRGVHRILPLDNEGNTNRFFKGFITTITESNPGYTINPKAFDEQGLVGKKFGGVFGRREYQKDKFITELFNVRSIDKIKDVMPPSDRLLPKDEMADFTSEFATITDDDLPF